MATTNGAESFERAGSRTADGHFARVARDIKSIVLLAAINALIFADMGGFLIGPPPPEAAKM